jgi:PAS domain S-box-containing protein
LLTVINVRDGFVDTATGTDTVGSEGKGMRVYHASATCVGSPPDEPVIVLVLEDVTDERKAWEDLVLRDRAMAATVEGITISDRRLPDNPLIYVNAGFETITGYTRDEVLGRNCRFLQGPESNDAARAEIRSAIQENRFCVVELKNYRKDGSLFWNRLSITPICDESGAVTHFIGVQSDITERVESEARLRALTAELRRLNERLLHDLRTAAQIQRAQLPPARLEIPGVRVAWFFESCDALAGDMLNIVRLDDDTIAMYVLDVSGHGTGAALLSTSVSRLLQPDAGPASLVLDETRQGQGRRAMSPAKVIEQLNKTYAWDPESNQFFTIVYALMHPKRNLMRFTCAGHPSPIILSRDGRHQTFKPDGLPVGVADEAYSEAHAGLHRGDRVYLYSDGVVECMDDRSAIFGVARLIDILKENHGRNLDASVQTVREALTIWRGDRPVHDDTTLLALELI